MPRKARIDAPGALHHIIVRGIEQCQIFRDDRDRDQFIQRFSDILTDTETPCYAWALIPNHVHLLLKTGSLPIATVMRRLLTGHAVFYNKRHRRSGHLFQNRYKSILCQEDVYLLELVRYIHLNPIRAKLVQDIQALSQYPYSGHSVLMGKVKNEWQDINWVLGFYDNRMGVARRQYRAFVRKGVSQSETARGQSDAWTKLRQMVERAAKVCTAAARTYHPSCRPYLTLGAVSVYIRCLPT